MGLGACQVKPASAMSVRKDEIPQQSSAPLEGSLQQKLCLPGEEEKNRCTPNKDTECQCKPGPFRGEEAPEFCQKCSTRCPDGKVMVTDCTPWSNIKCVDQEAGLFDECWHKVIGFSSIWQHQTLSNSFCPTTMPRVDVVLGLSYAVFPDSLNWPEGSRLNILHRFCFAYGCICQNFRKMFTRLSSVIEDSRLRPRLLSIVFYRNQQHLKDLSGEDGCWFQQTPLTELATSTEELNICREQLLAREEEIALLNAERNNIMLLVEHLECRVSRYIPSLETTAGKWQAQSPDGMTNELEVLQALKSLFEHHKALDKKRTRDEDLAQVIELQDIIEKKSREQREMRDRLAALSAHVTELEKDLDTARKDLLKSKEANVKLQQDVRDAMAQKEDMEKRITTLEKRYLAAQRKAISVHNLHDKLENEIANKDSMHRQKEDKDRQLQECLELAEQKLQQMLTEVVAELTQQVAVLSEAKQREKMNEEHNEHSSDTVDKFLSVSDERLQLHLKERMAALEDKVQPLKDQDRELEQQASVLANAGQLFESDKGVSDGEGDRDTLFSAPARLSPSGPAVAKTLAMRIQEQLDKINEEIWFIQKDKENTDQREEGIESRVGSGSFSNLRRFESSSSLNLDPASSHAGSFPPSRGRTMPERRQPSPQPEEDKLGFMTLELATSTEELNICREQLLAREEEIALLNAERNNIMLLVEHLECRVSRYIPSLETTAGKWQAQCPDGMTNELEVLQVLKSLFEHHKALDKKRTRDEDLAQVIELQDIIEKKSREQREMRDRLAALSAHVTELEKDLDTARKDLLKSKEANVKLQQDVRDAMAQKEDMEKRITTLEKRYLAAQRKAISVHNLHDKLENEIANKDSMHRQKEDKDRQLRECLELADQKLQQMLTEVVAELTQQVAVLSEAKQREKMNEEHNEHSSDTVDKFLSVSDERLQLHLKERMAALEDKVQPLKDQDRELEQQASVLANAGQLFESDKGVSDGEGDRDTLFSAPARLSPSRPAVAKTLAMRIQEQLDKINEEIWFIQKDKENTDQREEGIESRVGSGSFSNLRRFESSSSLNLDPASSHAGSFPPSRGRSMPERRQPSPEPEEDKLGFMTLLPAIQEEVEDDTIKCETSTSASLRSFRLDRLTDSLRTASDEDIRDAHNATGSQDGPRGNPSNSNSSQKAPKKKGIKSSIGRWFGKKEKSRPGHTSKEALGPGLLRPQTCEPYKELATSTEEELNVCREQLFAREEEIALLNAERNNTRLLLEHMEFLVSRYTPSLQTTVGKWQAQSPDGMTSELEVLKSLKILFEHHKALDKKRTCDEDVAQVIELKEIIKKKSREQREMKDRLAALSAHVTELEKDLDTARKDLLKSKEVKVKLQQDIREDNIGYLVSMEGPEKDFEPADRTRIGSKLCSWFERFLHGV
ncbi:hypothetical protein MG293_014703 [Ovis ammon polii]|uniref:TNFR-Cys domain-containing protein n=1 Tax=Ovis ammon polii TaxID=230172 RepID=A0AAD4TZD2_OVIAM|nr:hypothetical protein MG293_014703 [Ovis ammon polii]